MKKLGECILRLTSELLLQTTVSHISKEVEVFIGCENLLLTYRENTENEIVGLISSL